MSSIRLTRIRILAEFVVDPGEDLPLTPGRFGPVDLTPTEWAELDLQGRIQDEIQ